VQCSAYKRDGSRCSLPAKSDNGFCWAHDPANAEQRRKAASRAGKTKPNSELSDVKRRLKEVAEDVLSGRIATGRGSVAAQVYGVFLRCIEQERKQRELEELEERLAALEATREQGGKRSWGA
jgi:DNA repair exonuclease SbcCD ATPase subunit